jgi:hypothetical protein
MHFIDKGQGFVKSPVEQEASQLHLRDVDEIHRIILDKFRYGLPAEEIEHAMPGKFPGPFPAQNGELDEMQGGDGREAVIGEDILRSVAGFSHEQMYLVAAGCQGVAGPHDEDIMGPAKQKLLVVGIDDP